MAVDMEGLEFQIQANSDGAVKSVDALANSLGRLKNATKAYRVCPILLTNWGS